MDPYDRRQLQEPALPLGYFTPPLLANRRRPRPHWTGIVVVLVIVVMGSAAGAFFILAW